MTQKKVFIINDTSFEAHFGCNAVMQGLKSILATNNANVVGTLPVSKNWEPEVKRIVNLKPTLIIVNGEGSIHNDSTNFRARKLLEVGRYFRDIGIPIYLINTTLENISAEGKYLLKDFTGIILRDHESKNELIDKSNLLGVVPDLAILYLYEITKNIRQPSRPNNDTFKLLVSDSWYPRLSDKVLEIIKRRKLEISLQYLKMSNAKPQIPIYIVILRKLNQLLGYPYSYIKKGSIMTNDPQNFIKALLEKDFHITGRYHGVAFSIALGIPFVALSSNTRKIENLLMFVFGKADRVCEVEQLSSCEFKRFDFTENTLIENFVTSGIKKRNDLFEVILHG